MKKRYFIYLIAILLFVLFIPQETSYSWGFYGHKQINKMAVFTLPYEMIGFYKKHIDYITNHAVDPDKRRYTVKNEAPRHYIDLEHYGHNALDSIPKIWKRAVEKYSEDTLMAYGIVPWQIEKHYINLIYAFKNESLNEILRYSSELGHYLADAHVPLHTTENYNGQLTDQHGIHGFWESRIPELKGTTYDYFVGKAKYIDSPSETAWKIVKDSHLAVDSVLRFEKALHKEFPMDQKYSYETKAASLQKVYSLEYTNRYNMMLNGQVERRMRESIIMLGSFWYTAWIVAGKPNLDKLKDKIESDTLKIDQPNLEVLPQNIILKNNNGHED